jgi:hypothetical protein
VKIAFCGASGTGKTTLAEWVSETYNLPMNPVGSRSVARLMGFDNPYDVDRADLATYQAFVLDLEDFEETPENLSGAANQAIDEYIDGESVRGLFQTQLQRAKINWEVSQSRFVSDRTTVDDFAYSCLHDIGFVDEAFIERARKHLQIYDLIVFCRSDVFCNLDGDPHRVAAKSYHEVFDLLADGALVNWLGDDWNEKVLVLDSANLEERKEAIRRHVRVGYLSRL